MAEKLRIKSSPYFSLFSARIHKYLRMEKSREYIGSSPYGSRHDTAGPGPFPDMGR